MKKLTDSEIALLEHHVENGLLSKRIHLFHKELAIYNYTNSCVIEGKWDSLLLQCRGLVLDNEYNIIARPIKKFFNYEELVFKNEIPSLPYIIEEKMDGSYINLFHYNNRWIFSTRGTFDSEQAYYAKHIFNLKYANIYEQLDTSKTYIFEVIYRENRIVVDYADIEDLFLLTIIDTESGQETDVSTVNLPFPKPKRYKFDEMPGSADLLELKNHSTDNSEGFVIKFSNNYRLKIKFESYKILHRLITNINEKTIWAALKTGYDITEFFVDGFDDHKTWILSIKNELLAKYELLKTTYEAIFNDNYTENRKEFALKVKHFPSAKLLFLLYDNNLDKFNSYLYDIIKPERCTKWQNL
jgi:RNA ligase